MLFVPLVALGQRTALAAARIHQPEMGALMGQVAVSVQLVEQAVVLARNHAQLLFLFILFAFQFLGIRFADGAE